MSHVSESKTQRRSTARFPPQILHREIRWRRELIRHPTISPLPIFPVLSAAFLLFVFHFQVFFFLVSSQKRKKKKEISLSLILFLHNDDLFFNFIFLFFFFEQVNRFVCTSSFLLDVGLLVSFLHCLFFFSDLFCDDSFGLSSTAPVKSSLKADSSRGSTASFFIAPALPLPPSSASSVSQSVLKISADVPVAHATSMSFSPSFASASVPSSSASPSLLTHESPLSLLLDPVAASSTFNDPKSNSSNGDCDEDPQDSTSAAEPVSLSFSSSSSSSFPSGGLSSFPPLPPPEIRFPFSDFFSASSVSTSNSSSSSASSSSFPNCVTRSQIRRWESEVGVGVGAGAVVEESETTATEPSNESNSTSNDHNDPGPTNDNSSGFWLSPEQSTLRYSVLRFVQADPSWTWRRVAIASHISRQHLVAFVDSNQPLNQSMLVLLCVSCFPHLSFAAVSFWSPIRHLSSLCFCCCVFSFSFFRFSGSFLLLLCLPILLPHLWPFSFLSLFVFDCCSLIGQFEKLRTWLEREERKGGGRGSEMMAEEADAALAEERVDAAGASSSSSASENKADVVEDDEEVRFLRFALCIFRSVFWCTFPCIILLFHSPMFCFP